MSADRPANPRPAKWLGALAAAIGIFLMLLGLGIVPAGKANPNDPLWVGFVVGFVFLLAGLAVMLQDYAGANERGEIPAGAPGWVRAAQSLIVFLIFISFALIASYVALAGDARNFSGGIPFVGDATNVSIARIVFGIGALICWAVAIAFAVARARKIIGGGEG